MQTTELPKVPINKSAQLDEKYAKCLLISMVITQTPGMVFQHFGKKNFCPHPF